MLTVKLLDEEGYPIKAEHDFTISLSSLSSIVGIVPISGNIGKGEQLRYTA